MNQNARQILALFVLARRKFGHGFTPVQLARTLDIDAAQIRAVERGQVIRADVAVKLGAWCGIRLAGEDWVAVSSEGGVNSLGLELRMLADEQISLDEANPKVYEPLQSQCEAGELPIAERRKLRMAVIRQGREDAA